MAVLVKNTHPQETRTTKIQEIDYFRKVKKLHFACERGSLKDEQLVVRLLEKDPKKYMYERGDPNHFINVKNVLGQTPLYVACMHGNLHIVKLLIAEGCNPFIKSATECPANSKGPQPDTMESNLQVAARWGHFDILRYLLDHADDSAQGNYQDELMSTLRDRRVIDNWWSKEDLRDAIQTESISRQIKNLLLDYYRVNYYPSKLCFFRCCISIW